jgi:hypothetical protein
MPPPIGGRMIKAGPFHRKEFEIHQPAGDV